MPAKNAQQVICTAHINIRVLVLFGVTQFFQMISYFEMSRKKKITSKLSQRECMLNFFKLNKSLYNRKTGIKSFIPTSRGTSQRSEMNAERAIDQCTNRGLEHNRWFSPPQLSFSLFLKERATNYDSSNLTSSGTNLIQLGVSKKTAGGVLVYVSIAT